MLTETVATVRRLRIGNCNAISTLIIIFKQCLKEAGDDYQLILAASGLKSNLGDLDKVKAELGKIIDAGNE